MHVCVCFCGIMHYSLVGEQIVSVRKTLYLRAILVFNQWIPVYLDMAYASMCRTVLGGVWGSCQICMHYFFSYDVIACTHWLRNVRYYSRTPRK